VSVAEVGRELGVRYVLEGSFQQAGQMLRVSTQLVEAATGRTIWSARFDGARDDVFALQDEITSKIVAVIEPKLVLAEVERVKTLPTENLHAYELCLQALPMVDRPSSLAAMERAIDLAEAGHCRRPGLFLCQGAACLGTCDSICQSMDQFCASARWVEVH